MSCVRKAVASVLPWKDDEGVRTLFSLNLAIQCCLAVSVTELAGPCATLSYQWFAPSTQVSVLLHIPWSPARWVLSACRHVEFSCFDID